MLIHHGLVENKGVQSLIEIQHRYRTMMNRKPDYSDRNKLIYLFENRGFNSENMRNAGLISIDNQHLTVKVESPFHEYIEAKIALQDKLPALILIEETWYEILTNSPEINKKGVQYQINMIGKERPDDNRNKLKGNPASVSLLTTDRPLSVSEIRGGVICFEEVAGGIIDGVPVTHQLKVTSDGSYHTFLEQLRQGYEYLNVGKKWEIRKDKLRFSVVATTIENGIVIYSLRMLT